jgi:hypothetical protein
VPLYSQREVAQIVRASTSTIHRWAAGDSRSIPLITRTDAGRGITVPFIGLAEAFVVNAFRKAGLPMQRIRPAVTILQQRIGLAHALANNRLLTDGVEILFDTGDPDDRRLIVLRNGQYIFNEVVTDYLRRIDFSEAGYVRSIQLPQYPM